MGVTFDVGVSGKFLFCGDKKLFIKGFSDTSFCSSQLKKSDKLKINTVWLKQASLTDLDNLANNGLRAIISLGLDELLFKTFSGVETSTNHWGKSLIKKIVNHPAILAYDLGGPISTAIIRWLGLSNFKKLLLKSFRIVKEVAKERLVTYTSQPDYPNIALDFLDFLCYQVAENQLSDYRITIARLQNFSHNLPLVLRITVPSNSLINESERSYRLDRQIRMAFNAGCAGVILENWRDPHLGLLQSNGKEKGIFRVVSRAFEETPFPKHISYPRISIVICAYNAEKYIEECLEGVSRLEYPNFEVIIVNDGSKDKTAEIAKKKSKRFGFHVVDLEENAGLSAARNVGLEYCTGEIVAYLDSDAFPDKHWLYYLALTFLNSKHAVIGGPNLMPKNSDFTEQCIDKVQGNPQIVMANDELADHIPGCNLATRVSFLKTIGGFDPRYRTAGDDVNFCWKVLKYGGTLGVSHGAMVWHHRRSAIRGFLNQQTGYGKAEAILEKDWPERFNFLGHQVKIKQRMASPGSNTDYPLFCAGVYQGFLNGFQSFGRFLYFTALMPEVPIIVLFFGTLLIPTIVPLFIIGLVALWFLQASYFWLNVDTGKVSFLNRLIVAFLSISQPIARTYGRWKNKLVPWRNRIKGKNFYPNPRVLSFKNSGNFSQEKTFRFLKNALENNHVHMNFGEKHDGWDFKIEGGFAGGAKCLLETNQKEVTIKVFPYISTLSKLLFLYCFLTTIIALFTKHYWNIFASIVLISYISLKTFRQTGAAITELCRIAEDSFKKCNFWEKFRPPRDFLDEVIE